MLKELYIENFALISSLNLTLPAGFIVFTGETGAGKSILIQGLNMVLGEHVREEVIRSGFEKCRVEAVFDISSNLQIKKHLKEMGLKQEDSLLISRQFSAKSGSSCRINGQAVTLGMLKEISRNLVDIHGQHEHQSLFNLEFQRDLLDRMGGDKLFKLKEKFQENYYKLKQKEEELEKLKTKEKERTNLVELYRFQIEECERANLKEGEDEELEKELRILQNAEKLEQGIKLVYELLYGTDTKETSIWDNLQMVSSKILELSNIDEKLKSEKNLTDAILYQLEELISNLRNYQNSIEFNPKALEELMDRMELIKNLKRKYGNTIPAILQYKERIKKEYEDLSFEEERCEKIVLEIDNLKRILTDVAKELSKQREKVGRQLEKEVERELSALAMEGTKFKVDIKQEPSEVGLEIDGDKVAFYPWGIDKVEYLISPNPGEPLKPLNKIASGGEVSRIMLALKSILSRVDEVKTLIFDEIDVGIGGKASVRIAGKLADLAKNYQVICITHLPTIASHADAHFYVEKKEEEGRTVVSIEYLNKKARVKELARMLRGVDISEATMKDAEELIAKVDKKKGKKR